MIIHEHESIKMGKVIRGKNAGTLSIEEVNDIEKFQILKEPWDALLRKSTDNNIFLTWEWLFTWWQHYGEGNKLRIIIVREEDKIIGIVPLMETTYRQGFIIIKVLENLCSENCDYSGIILADKNHEALTLIMDYLARIIKDESLIVRMYHIPENSAFITLLRELYPSFLKSFYLDEKQSSQCLSITLPATWDEYFRTLGQKTRGNIKRNTRYLQKDHNVEFKKVTDDNELQENLQTLFELHQKKWGRENILSKFTDPQTRAFYINVSKAFRQNNWLNFSVLDVDGKPESIHWGFIYNDAYWGMTQALDPDHPNYNAGHVHLVKLIEDAIQQGLKKFDFLKGDEPYKDHWTNSQRNNIRITMARSGIRGRYRVKLFQTLIKYRNAKERSFGENISLVLRKVRSKGKSNSKKNSGGHLVNNID
jgi:CelD/BcsL family acetyltransferase involved in cellulose biosynthesis